MTSLPKGLKRLLTLLGWAVCLGIMAAFLAASVAFCVHVADATGAKWVGYALFFGAGLVGIPLYGLSLCMGKATPVALSISFVLNTVLLPVAWGTVCAHYGWGWGWGVALSAAGGGTLIVWGLLLCLLSQKD